MKTDLTSLDQIRQAGSVSRFHTATTLLEHTVGGHSWNVALLVYALDPEVRTDVIVAALLHDVEEGITGDVPSPAKWRWPELARVLAFVEVDIRDELDILFDLTASERALIAAADYLEIVLATRDELLVGNRTFRIVAERLANHRVNSDLLTFAIAERFWQLYTTIWREVDTLRRQP